MAAGVVLVNGVLSSDSFLDQHHPPASLSLGFPLLSLGGELSRTHPKNCGIIRRMINFNVNGTSRTFDGDEDMPLLWHLRDDLRLTGTRFGCGLGLCGACTVHVDGVAMRSCQTKMST